MKNVIQSKKLPVTSPTITGEPTRETRECLRETPGSSRLKYGKTLEKDLNEIFTGETDQLLLAMRESSRKVIYIYIYIYSIRRTQAKRI